MCLSGLPGLPAFDTVGEPATLAQRWTTWKAEFELYVTASGLSDATQKRALLLHLVGPRVRDIFNTSILAEVRGGAKDYDKAMDSLSDHFKHRKNAPMARQTFLAAKPSACETIDNFITRLQKVAEHCDYEAERDNQVRDRAISFIKNRNLKVKLYREETLSLSKLLEIVSQFHDKEALTLAPEGQVNNVHADSRQGGKCWRCDKVGHFAKDCYRSRDRKCGKCGKVGHFEVCCNTKQTKQDTLNRDSSRFRGNTHGKPKHGRTARNPRGQRDARQVTEQTMDESRGNRDDFYVFSARSGEAQNTVEMLIEDKPINVITDSGTNCNLMSEGVFEFVKEGNASLLECDKRVYADGSNEPLQLRRKCDVIAEVPQTRKSLNVEFYIMRSKAATLLGCDTSELLGVLRVGVPINSCELKHDSPRDTAKRANRKAALKAKVQKVFEGLGKLKDYQLKLHVDIKCSARSSASATNSL